MENHKFHINNSPFVYNIEDISTEKERKELIKNRPITSHFHPDKGSKYDVLTPEDEKYPHVADRLGHPE